ncbi:MAG: NAD(P)H-dependent oxidoreductase, partial [Candidatus Hydrogenedentes bacterium]|nr:NAD(P)H-dependent oxidoreductase [Candidatus Hydrogenedentota bacterium]
MRCLVVKAHPLAESLCSSMTQRIVEFLRTNGHEVILEDLDAQQFEAAMTAAERASYYDGPYTTESVADHVEHLRAAEAIVLIFPTWWFGPP